MFFKHEDETLDYLDKKVNKPQEIKREIQRINKTNTAIQNEYFTPPIIFLCATLFTIIVIYLNLNKNPIIGKWKPINNNFMLNSEIEFTDKRMFFMGMVSDVKYETDNDKIIVFDKEGIFKNIGNVYTIKNKDTMENNSFGIKTLYKRIE